MAEKRYFPEITTARGITMLLVIIAHAFPDSNRFRMHDMLAQTMHHAIHTFHMGAFVFLAGFVAAAKLFGEGSVKGEIRKRFERLMIPYFCWTAVLVLLKQAFGFLARDRYPLSDAWKLLIGAERIGWLWYLLALFLISALFLLISRATKSQGVLLGVGCVMYVIWTFFPEMYMERVMKYAIFFIGGACARIHYPKLLKMLRSPLTALLGIALVLAKPLLNLPYLVTGIAGTALILHTALMLEKHPGRVQKFFTEMGERCFDIYLLGYYVQIPARVVMQKFLHVPYWPQVILCIAAGVIVPLLLSRYVVPKTGWFRRVFLGHAK